MTECGRLPHKILTWCFSQWCLLSRLSSNSSFNFYLPFYDLTFFWNTSSFNPGNTLALISKPQVRVTNVVLFRRLLLHGETGIYLEWFWWHLDQINTFVGTIRLRITLSPLEPCLFGPWVKVVFLWLTGYIYFSPFLSCFLFHVLHFSLTNSWLLSLGEPGS